jgi:Na+/alanine symporter
MPEVLLLVGNFVFSSALAWQALLRLNLMSASRTRRRYRLLYVAVLGGAMISALSSLIFGDAPGLVRLLIEVIAILMLRESAPLWHSGCPMHTSREHAGEPFLHWWRW